MYSTPSARPSYKYLFRGNREESGKPPVARFGYPATGGSELRFSSVRSPFLGVSTHY